MEELLKLAQQLEIHQLIMFAVFYWLMCRRMDAKFDKLDAKIDKLIERVGALESRVSRIEGMLMNKECCFLKSDEHQKKAE